MSDPVLPGEGPDPMTDEALAEAQAFVDGNLLTGLDGPAVVDLVRRLLTEVNRRRSNTVGLIEASGGAWAEAARVTRGLHAELAAARSECAALTAKVEADNAQNLRVINQLTADNAGLTACLDAVHDVITPKNPDWVPLTERHPEYFPPESPEETARKKGWRQGVDLLTQQIRAALNGSGMPHTPAQEAAPDLSLIPADLIVSDPEVCSGRPTMRGTRILASMIAGHLAAGTTWEELSVWYPSMPIPPAEINGDGPADTGRGTGVREPHARSEAVVWGQGAACPHKPEWHCEAHGECRGCECGCDTVNPEVNDDDAIPSFLPVEEGP